MSNSISKKTDQTIINKLHSTNSETVLKTIGQLRETGNSSYIPVLIELLHTTEYSGVKSQIASLLAELKHKDVVPMLIEAIQNKKYLNELKYLVSACWENGLDYSEHLSLFIDLVIERDFIVAFEAHTVITNMSGKISQGIADKETKKIKEAIVQAEDEKKQLLHDLLDFLPVFQQGIEPQSY